MTKPTKKNRNTRALLSYLAGLWEGNGQITLPKEVATGRLKCTPALHITFAQVNLPLVKLFVCLWGGWILHKKGVNALVWTVTRRADLLSLLVSLELYLRTAKAYDFHLLLAFLHKRCACTSKKSSSVSKIEVGHAKFSPSYEQASFRLERAVIPPSSACGVTSISLLKDSWLAGFIDADGHFKISIRKVGVLERRRTRVEVGFVIEQQKDHKKSGEPFLFVMRSISELLDVNLRESLHSGRRY